MRQYLLRLEKYGISEKRYKELKIICEQYDDYRREDAAFRRGEADRVNAGNGVWHGRPDPTAAEAIRWTESRAGERVRAIEQAAITADPMLCRYIIENVCRGVPFREMNVPCGERQFFMIRQSFFMELNCRV